MIGKGNDCLFPLYIRLNHCERAFARSNFLRVPCGHCINCRSRRAQEWCIRLECEAQYWRDISFLTLTYDDLNLPTHVVDGRLFFSDEEIRQNPDYSNFYVPTLRPDHLRNFVKRLRKRLDYKIKYYAVGEYGTKRGRSHMHLMVFGLPYVPRKTEALIQSCWNFGHVNVRPFFKETCTYIAGYVQKKLYGKDKDFFRLPEFMRCSQHIGERWLYDHISEFDDEHPFINRNGYQYGLPRQFRKILIRAGVLKENTMVDMVNRQMEEYEELEKHLTNTGISSSEFFAGRLTMAIEKEKRKTASRIKTGDI